MIIEEPEVAIVGAGPAGAAAARALATSGVNNVLVIEREREPGGIPRFCDHRTFGVAEFGRLLTGPSYARHLLPLLAGVTLACETTVTRIDPDLSLTLSTPEGQKTIRPRRLLLATGIRETPRPAKLISGDRPDWVITTGALQRILHSSYRPPFRHPVVIGSELVSFSALLTLGHLGIRPVAMIEANNRITAQRPGDIFARLAFGIPVLTSTRVVSINATADRPLQLASVTVEEPSGRQRTIECDAVIFTGAFVPEASLLEGWAKPLLDQRTGGPAIDQSWRTADLRVFAAGNILRPVETAGWSFAEGAAAGRMIAADIRSPRAAAVRQVPVQLRGPIKYVVPSMVAHEGYAGRMRFQIRVACKASGHFELRVDDNVVWRSRRHRCRRNAGSFLSLMNSAPRP